VTPRTTDELDAGVDTIAAAPTDAGTVRLVVRRPAIDEREILDVGRLDPTVGLTGDTWAIRGSRRTEDGSAHPDMQLNVMSARVIELLAGPDHERWALAGDQLYLDLDLSEGNLPAGTRLSLGSAEIEVTDQPHTGCAKFSARFGADAMRWVNTPDGRAERRRGLNARVVVAGEVRPGDEVRVVARPA
jgi:hypothetical protein